jgi:hypothetical protein
MSKEFKEERWRCCLLRHAMCRGVPCGGEDSCQGDSAVLLSIGNAQSRKAWIDATIRELDRLKSTLETIDTPG